jgi:hypothetical protein
LVEWLFIPGAVLLGIGCLILLSAIGYWLLVHRRRRRLSQLGDDLPTQILSDAEESNADAFLVALDKSMRLPQRIPLYKGREVRLGRDRRANTVTLNDISISRIHAIIAGRGTDFIIRDEGSRGGTFVNRHRLRSSERHRLNHNDVVQFYTFSYRFVMAEAPTEVPDAEATLSTQLDIDQIR